MAAIWLGQMHSDPGVGFIRVFFLAGRFFLDLSGGGMEVQKVVGGVSLGSGVDLVLYSDLWGLCAGGDGGAGGAGGMEVEWELPGTGDHVCAV